MADVPKVIQAAGGIILRNAGAQQEVLLAHRKRYGDWTMPKGKLNSGESHDAAALREVREETGCEVCLQGSAGAISYEYNGVVKIVAQAHIVAARGRQGALVG
jgi:8-oxo-dGTP diphosphatase